MECKIVKYRHESRMAVYFEKNKELTARIKKPDDAPALLVLSGA